MFEAGLVFESEIDPIVTAFRTLPAELRPIHFSHEERINSPNDKIEAPSFLDFLARSRSGFFLLGPGLTYSVRIASGRGTLCDCFLNIEYSRLKQFLMHMSSARPTFGFACTPEEREHRNRVKRKLGTNTLESWVGRDTANYVPGLYWLTLLPKSLLDSHNVALSEIVKVALNHLDLPGGQHLFQFYEKPEDWRSDTNVAQLISEQAGIFDLRRIKPQLEKAQNVLEFNKVIQNWR